MHPCIALRPSTCSVLIWHRSRSTVSLWRAATPRASSLSAASCASKASIALRSFLVGSWRRAGEGWRRARRARGVTERRKERGEREEE